MQQTSYNYDGPEDDYVLLNLYASDVAKGLLKQASKVDQKDFYILDTGGAKGGWSIYCAKKLKDTAKELNINVNIISITGDGNFEEKILFNESNCKVINISGFKVENLYEEFQKTNFKDIKFDFITSQYTFMHLVDPIGTFAQIYDILKQDGIVLSDGFTFGKNNKIIDDWLAYFDELKFVSEFDQDQVLFLLLPRHPYFNLCIQKASLKDVEFKQLLNFMYTDNIVEGPHISHANIRADFTVLSQKKTASNSPDDYEYKIRGSEDLYDFLNSLAENDYRKFSLPYSGNLFQENVNLAGDNEEGLCLPLCALI